MSTFLLIYLSGGQAVSDVFDGVLLSRYCTDRMLDITIELDVREFCCPMPLLKAKQTLNKMAAGEVLRVLTTDIGSVRDFRRFSELAGHCLLSSEESEGVFVHTLQKHE